MTVIVIRTSEVIVYAVAAWIAIGCIQYTIIDAWLSKYRWSKHDD